MRVSFSIHTHTQISQAASAVLRMCFIFIVCTVLIILLQVLGYWVGITYFNNYYSPKQQFEPPLWNYFILSTSILFVFFLCVRCRII